MGLIETGRIEIEVGGERFGLRLHCCDKEAAPQDEGTFITAWIVANVIVNPHSPRLQRRLKVHVFEPATCS
jgi:hypothetical protein